MTKYRAPKHQVFLKKKEHGYEIDSWCTEQFGERWSITKNTKGKWCSFWAGREKPRYYRWCFTDEKDMTLFLLRWE